MSKKAISRILFFVGLGLVVIPSWFGASLSREIRLATCILGLLLMVADIIYRFSTK